MLIRQNVWRPALAEHFYLKISDAKSRWMAGLSNAINGLETTSIEIEVFFF